MTSTTLSRKTEALKLPYQPKNYDSLFKMSGFSEKLLANHFKLYEGYVANTNALREALSDAGAEGGLSPASSEVRRRFGWEYNGMCLHEFYFDNLGGRGGEPGRQTGFRRQLEEQFGSFDQWKEEFQGIGAMRGIGWAALVEDPRNGRFFNTWIDEHNTGHLIGCRPLLVLDVFEHAFILDYGMDKKKYMAAFFANANWDAVQNRFESAPPGGL